VSPFRIALAELRCLVDEFVRVGFHFGRDRVDRCRGVLAIDAGDHDDGIVGIRRSCRVVDWVRCGGQHGGHSDQRERDRRDGRREEGKERGERAFAGGLQRKKTARIRRCLRRSQTSKRRWW
jgi:hypothetical protein